CVIERIDRRTGHARFGLPRLPEIAGTAPDAKRIALALGLEPADIGWGPHHPSGYSAGVIFYLVPVKNAGVLAEVKPVRRGWAELIPSAHSSVYVYTATPNAAGSDYAARMFSPGLGLGE